MQSIEAVVQAAGTATSYRRAGSGPPVLLLTAESARAPVPGSMHDSVALLDALATDYRVFMPRARAGSRGMVQCGDDAAVIDGSDWLRHLVDGLGLDRPAVLADATFAALARRFARSDPERIGRVVLLGTTAITPTAMADVRRRLGGPAGERTVDNGRVAP